MKIQNKYKWLLICSLILSQQAFGMGGRQLDDLKDTAIIQMGGSYELDGENDSCQNNLRINTYGTTSAEIVRSKDSRIVADRSTLRDGWKENCNEKMMWYCRETTQEDDGTAFTETSTTHFYYTINWGETRKTYFKLQKIMDNKLITTFKDGNYTRLCHYKKTNHI